jgi:uncharacterized glyoxalase superfamily protein PhnB
MVDNPPAGYPRIAPYLLYRDLEGAIDFTVKAFGFTEDLRVPGPDGKATHAELRLGDGIVMMGAPGGDFRNPSTLGGSTHLVHVYVDDVDAHCETARSAGAKILREPANQPYGDRNYNAEDPEGHHWYFAQHVRDVAPDEMNG